MTTPSEHGLPEFPPGYVNPRLPFNRIRVRFVEVLLPSLVGLHAPAEIASQAVAIADAVIVKLAEGEQ